MSKITKAIIPAAGFGTRFLPAAKSLGFLQATVEFALQRDNLRDDFLAYLERIVQEQKQ